MRNLANTTLIVAFLAGLVLLPIARVPQLADHALARLIAAIVLCLGAGSWLVMLTPRTGQGVHLLVGALAVAGQPIKTRQDSCNHRFRTTREPK